VCQRVKPHKNKSDIRLVAAGLQYNTLNRNQQQSVRDLLPRMKNVLRVSV
jgi:hypothetical protein